jgi:hypothetical protein
VTLPVPTLSDVEGIDGIDTATPHIETPDSHTVVIYHSVQTVWDSEMIGGVPIIPKHVWENIAPENCEAEGEYVATGNLTCSDPYVIAGLLRRRMMAPRGKPQLL